VSILLEHKDKWKGDLEIEDKDLYTDSMQITIGLFHDACSYDLSREEAIIVWRHIGEEFGFSNPFIGCL
jgi:hypothetical protein